MFSVLSQNKSMTAKYLLLVCIFLALISCKENDFDSGENSEKLVGYWVNPTYQDSITILEKASKLSDNNYGIAFMSDGKLVERKNSGWCGTPPISYGDFNGTWEMKDPVISISVDYWGGKASYKWEIVSVTDDQLKVLVKEQKYDDPSGK